MSATTFQLEGLSRPYQGEKTDEIIWQICLGDKKFRKAIFMSADEERAFLEGDIAGYFASLLIQKGWVDLAKLAPNARLVKLVAASLEAERLEAAGGAE